VAVGRSLAVFISSHCAHTTYHTPFFERTALMRSTPDCSSCTRGGDCTAWMKGLCVCTSIKLVSYGVMRPRMWRAQTGRWSRLIWAQSATNLCSRRLASFASLIVRGHAEGRLCGVAAIFSVASPEVSKRSTCPKHQIKLYAAARRHAPPRAATYCRPVRIDAAIACVSARLPERCSLAKPGPV